MLLALACLLLSTPPHVRSETGGPALRLKAGLVDTSVSPVLPAANSDPYRIVQFQGPILPAWREALETSGATLLDYLPDYAYIVRLKDAAHATLQALPGVRWVGPYRAQYKLSPELAKAEGQVEVIIQVFAGEDPQAVAKALEGWGGKVRSSSKGELASYMRAIIPAAALPKLATLPAVSWIEPPLPAELDNDVARRYDIMAVNPVWAGLGLYGAGQIIAVADSGLDTGNPETLHADFRGRLLKAYGLGRPDEWSDPKGHGTHVAGSVLGNGAMSGSNPAAHDYADSFAGVAPEAKLVFQSTLDADGGLGGIPDNLNDLLGPPYQDGARIHTNSWSEYGVPDADSVNGVYNTRSRQLDEFVWNHRDMVVLFSASNAGKDSGGDGVVDTDSVRPPGTAKSSITVGATENYRPDHTDTYGQWWPPDFPADPLKNDRMSNDMGGMAAFSGRGPLDDERIKPDIAAPGTFVLSVRSQAASGSGWGIYNDYYLYMGGTSMSTPLTAGSAALVRQAYMQRLGVAAPSAALVKATLLNGARDVYPGQYGEGPCQEIGSPVPNWDTGWGRLNLRDSIMPVAPRMVRFVEEKGGLQTGQSRTYTAQVVLTGAGQGNRSSTGLAELRLAPLDADPTESSALSQSSQGETNAATCTNRVSNGGFEYQFTGWTTEGRTELSGEDVHSGRYSAWLGGLNNAHDWLYQAVLVPSDISDGEISFWVYQDSDEPDCDCDYFWAGLYDPDWRTTYADIHYRDGPAKTNGWQKVAHRLTPEEIEDIRGKRIYLAFEVKTDGSKVTSVWVDDVQFTVCTGGRLKPGPLRATLVWSDYPGALEAAKALVNDLDLEVIDPSGRHYYGNGTQPDRLNPVEDVLIREPQVGRYQIIVKGYNVPMGPQPYALVISADEPPIVRNKHAWLPFLRRR